MRRITALLTLLLVVQFAKAQWAQLVSGIPDTLNDVWFWDDNGVLAADHGVWYTTNGGIGLGSWSHFEVNGPQADQDLYAHTRFKAVSSAWNNVGIGYFCGTDTVDHRAVALKVDILAQTYLFMYIGGPGTSLNAIAMEHSGYVVSAVGDAGLMLNSNDLLTFTTLDTAVTGITSDLITIRNHNSSSVILGEDFFLPCTQNWDLSWSGTPYPVPGNMMRAVMPGVLGDKTYGVGDQVYTMYASPYSVSASTPYEQGPLNATGIAWGAQNAFLVSTDHGIYKGSYAMSYLEPQPSTIGMNVRNVVCPGTVGNIGYAVCVGGVVLKTTNSGGAAVPYLTASALTDCVGGTFHASSSAGSATTCHWLVDGIGVTGGCTGTTIPGQPMGEHTVTFIGANNQFADTITFSVTTPEPPLTTLTVSLDDTIFCKTAVINITIEDTEGDVEYSFIDATHNIILGSIIGNGGTMTGSTSVIDTTVDLTIRARRVNTECMAMFPDTTRILVERTRARFHADLVNAEPGEGVDFFQGCRDAQHFAWTLYGAQPGTSTEEDPSLVTYSTPGQTSVQLICWTDLGCYDTLLANGPYIYEEPAVLDSCWAMQVHGDDPPWPGFYYDKVGGATSTGDGFIICGQASDLILPSRTGNASEFLPGTGTYVAKYSYTGVLKWFMYSHTVPYHEYTTPEMEAAAVTPEGDIVITGNEILDSWFYLNTGDSVRLTPWDGGECVIARLSSRGHVVWWGNYQNIDPIAMTVDAAGNTLVMGMTDWLTSYQIGEVEYPTLQTGSEDIVMAKIAPDGSLVWQTWFTMDTWNSAGCLALSTDDQGDIYLGGSYDMDILFRSAAGGPTHLLTSESVDPRCFLVKFDTDGQFLWLVAAQDTLGTPDSEIRAIAADPAGGCYITGTTGLHSSWGPVVLSHSDGSSWNWSGFGNYFVAKLDADGHQEWATGTNFETFEHPGQSINLNSHGLLVGGYMGDEPDFQGLFYSTDGTSTPMLLGCGLIYVVNYSTDGVVQEIFRASDDLYAVPLRATYKFHIFRDTVGHVFSIADFRTDNGDTAQFFGTSFTTTSDWDSFIMCSGVHSCYEAPITLSSGPAPGNEQLTVRPNPFISDLNLSTPYSGVLTVTVRDLLGRLLFVKSFPSGRDIHLTSADLSRLSGPLLLNVRGNEGSSTVRIIRAE